MLPVYGSPAQASDPGANAHEGAPAGEAGGEHHGPDYATIGVQFVNLGLFLVLLVVFARRPILDALGNRANQVRRDLDESVRLKDEAVARYREIEQKLAGLDQRIDDMKETAAAEARAESARIAERAEADAVRIRDTAERTIREESQRARSEIRREVVVQATAAAREIVRQNVGSADQAKLEAEFMASVANGTPANRSDA